MIGLGLGDIDNISLKALDILKKCDKIYVENYTSKLVFDIRDFEILIGKEIILADRDLVENNDEIVKNSVDNNVAFCVKGDVLGATTHIDIFLRSKNNNVQVKILHNASVLNAVGDCGLSLYKFGKVASIPFNNKNIKTPVDIFLSNYKSGMHTLFLFDLLPLENKYMDFKEAINYLISNCDTISNNTRIVVCAGLCTNEEIIKSGFVKDFINLNIDIYPQCLIIPGDLHFMEEEMLNIFSI